MMDVSISMNALRTRIIVLMKLTAPILKVDLLAVVKLDLMEMDISAQVRLFKQRNKCC